MTENKNLNPHDYTAHKWIVARDRAEEDYKKMYPKPERPQWQPLPIEDDEIAIRHGLGYLWLEVEPARASYGNDVKPPAVTLHLTQGSGHSEMSVSRKSLTKLRDVIDGVLDTMERQHEHAQEYNETYKLYKASLDDWHDGQRSFLDAVEDVWDKENGRNDDDDYGPDDDEIF